MKRVVAFAVITGIALSSKSEAPAAVVTVMSDLRAVEGDTTFEVPVLISGGERIQNLSVAFAVGDGGPVVGGSEVIPIVGVRYQGGTIFDGFPLLTNEAVPLPARSATIANATINMSDTDAFAGTAFDAQVAMVFTLDLSPLSAGDTITLNPNFNNLTQASNSDAIGNVLTLSFPEPLRLLTIQSSAVPEPGAWILLSGMAAVVLIRRKRVRV